MLEQRGSVMSDVTRLLIDRIPGILEVGGAWLCDLRSRVKIDILLTSNTLVSDTPPFRYQGDTLGKPSKSNLNKGREVGCVAVNSSFWRLPLLTWPDLTRVIWSPGKGPAKASSYFLGIYDQGCYNVTSYKSYMHRTFSLKRIKLISWARRPWTDPSPLYVHTKEASHFIIFYSEIKS